MQKKIIIDVRTKEEFAQGHAIGSVNIPLNELEAHSSTLSKDDPIILVCESGGRAAVAQMMLKRLGFTDVTSGGSWMGVGVMN